MPHPSTPLVPGLVHQRAIETPDAIAIVSTDRMLTYDELDSRAEKIALELRALGAGPDVVVGLLAGRSAEMIVGALAIMKAGAAYLPLDTAYPRERLAFIANDARCALLVAAPGCADRVAGSVTSSDHVLTIDLDAPRTNLLRERSEEPGLAPDRLAYVIYTSGSTGQPKGVELTHEGLANLIRWHQRNFHVTCADRATQIAAVGFDAAVWEIWPYLTTGATLYLPDEAVRTDPDALRDWLVKQRITIGFVPTPMAERLLASSWPKSCALRVMLTGGDTLHRYPPPDLPFLLVNNYGPTESTVVATSGPVLPYDQPDARPTIGHPIDGTQIHLLDDAMREVPLGTPGEIYIGGVGLARGYRHEPELTAARFVKDPFDARPGARLYKTGDLARRLPDGRIAFLGRVDDQVKIRGFRIEPHEVVTALNRHPDVLASAVVASERSGGEKQLVAYVVLDEGVRLTPSALKEHLHATLPEYMVPPTFVRIDTLPLGPHGKVDRHALPEPTPTNTMRDKEFEEPRSTMEKYLAGLIRGLLGIERVSADDNFFLLGGHSLMGTQLIGRIRAAFGVELNLRAVFESPTIARLAAEIERLVMAKMETLEGPTEGPIGGAKGSIGDDAKPAVSQR